jgi:site-specific recombinase XerD
MSKTPSRLGRHSATFPVLAQRLLPDDWPSADRLAWEAACRPGKGVTPPGAAARLRPATRAKNAQDWGSFLRYLMTVGELFDSESPAERLTPQRLGGYICAILRLNRASTVRTRIIQLSYMAKMLAPDREWAWVRQHAALPTEAEAAASRKQPRHIDPTQLIAESLSQCDAAAELPDPLLAAVRYRDGVLIALAYWCTIRRKNLAELTIGQSLIIMPEYIRIVFDTTVKNHRIFDVIVPNFLGRYLREYVLTYRPILLQGSADAGALWINLQGNPLSYAALYGLFMTRSGKLINERLNPHSTRHSMASTVMLNDPRDIDLAADCLGHRNTGTVTRYYNQSGPAAASAAWQRLVKKKLAHEQ